MGQANRLVRGAPLVLPAETQLVQHRYHLLFVEGVAVLLDDFPQLSAPLAFPKHLLDLLVQSAAHMLPDGPLAAPAAAKVPALRPEAAAAAGAEAAASLSASALSAESPSCTLIAPAHVAPIAVAAIVRPRLGRSAGGLDFPRLGLPILVELNLKVDILADPQSALLHLKPMNEDVPPEGLQRLRTIDESEALLLVERPDLSLIAWAPQCTS
mmetsp:Transcript_26047/g.74583  ORF Transcript_26047/g.74583 Transcript_26047/m.74583 type:complete len:212 (-) Transcript_26047:259-894(-)